MPRKVFQQGLVTFVILMVIVISGGSGANGANVLEKYQIQNQILEYVREAFVDSATAVDLLDGAIQGMIDKLDPHSSYLPPKSADEFSERILGGFEGIGITFSKIHGKITVIEVIENGPSERAGLRSRDKIVSIDGLDAIDLPDDSIKVLLRGPRNSRVSVGIERPGVDQVLNIGIIRDRVKLNSVSHAYMLDENTGYLAVTNFTIQTAEDVGAALEKLSDQGMKNVILDLRNNSGGSLQDAVGVVDYFISDGLIVETRGKRVVDNMKWNATGNAPYGDIPMIVMTNHGSASASEIVAGALQDHDRALIVGQTSFGKGLVMNQFNLRSTQRNDLGTFIMSVAKYYTPSGRLIQRDYNVDRETYIREGYDDYDPNASDSLLVGKPVFYTDIGREVYGGGGITPDKRLEPMSSLNSLESAIRRTNLCFEFADQYLLRHNDIPGRFDVFLDEYAVPERELLAFKDFIAENGIEVDNEPEIAVDLAAFVDDHDLPDGSETALRDALGDLGVDFNVSLFDQSREFIQRELKQEIARMLWGSEERYRVWHITDDELAQAISYLPEADLLLKKRLANGRTANTH